MIGIGRSAAVGFDDAFDVGAGVGDAAGVGAVPCMGDAGFATATPLSQTNFLPDLMHVKFLVVVELLEPAVVQAAPALGAAAKLCTGLIKLAAMKITTNPAIFFMWAR